uniref:hypothetical protein n=1 Tax=Prevotella sp. TaxID=59823 RepID=UPI004025CDB9
MDGEANKEDVLNNERVEYGKQVTFKLTEKYGKGRSFYKLQHCVRSAYTIDMDASTKATNIVYKTIHVQKVLYSFRPVMPIPSVARRLFFVPLIRFLAKPLRSVAGKCMVPWPAAEFPHGGFEETALKVTMHL